MVRRLLLLFLLVNVIGVVANLPRIVASLDGAAIGGTVGEWAVGLSAAVGNLIEEAEGAALTQEQVLAIEQDLLDGALDTPLDDESVSALVQLWRVLEAAGEQVRADELADLLLDEGVDVTDPEVVPTDPLG